jgi:dipeptidyl aminopeptidase/acylaminoacyl peptidase
MTTLDAPGGLLAMALLAGLAACGTSPGGDRGKRAATPQTAPYGTWASPLTAARATAGALRLDQIVLDGDDVYWIEGRASEGGRAVIVRQSGDGRATDVTPAGFYVRSRVHEYGCGAYAVHRGAVYFVNFADQRVYRQAAGEAPVPLTAEGHYFVDLHVDAARQRLLAVREDHTAAGEPASAIVALPLAAEAVPARGHAGTVLASGADFYSGPILSPDGTRLAWLEWRHPNMPWDGTELHVAALDAQGRPGRRARVAGGADESIFQPTWSPDGELVFVSDRTGWWNLYRVRGGAEGVARVLAGPGEGVDVEPLHPMAAEFGKPQWTTAMRTYAWVAPRRMVVSYSQDGHWKLALLETDPRKFEPLDLRVEPLESLAANGRAAYFVGGSPTEEPAIVRMTYAAAEAEVLKRSREERLDPASVSVPEAITFVAGDRQVHAFHYPPKHPGVVAPSGTFPPLIVMSHGGPTGATLPTLDPRVQFWTSRGFAVVDVNYSGSTGYGRAYRERLDGQWGVVDVQDVVAAARDLVARGKADPERLAIRGGSAGGYTTLAALTFTDTFKAGASYYGISDLEVLARDTHKFESRYTDSLLGPYPAQQALYRQRSPIHFVDRLGCALILFQGLEDKVVPPNQSAMMAEAVRAKGLPVAYVTFAGEQHGFRKAETQVRALEAELYFYGKVFGFTPADAIAPVAIDNLPPEAR